MSKKTVFVLALAFMLMVGLSAAVTSQACCAYNNTGGDVKFAWHMASDWHLGPHSKKCQNGKGGTMDVTWVLKMAKDIKICSGVPVAHHGWVSVYQSENLFTVKSFNKDGTVKVTCTRTIDSEIMGRE